MYFVSFLVMAVVGLYAYHLTKEHGEVLE